MSEQQSIGEAVRAANETLTAKPEAKETRQESKPVERDEPRSQVEDDDIPDAPKWTKQWKKPTRAALRKLYDAAKANGADDAFPALFGEIEERYDYSGKTQAEYDRYRKRFDPYDQVLAQLEPQFALQGMHPAQGIQQMAAVAGLLQQNPDQGIAYLAQMFRPRDAKALVQALVQNWGVDLNGLAAQAEWVDPAVQKLIAPLQQQNQQMYGLLQNFVGQQWQAGAQQVAHALTAFQQAKDESGNPKYPHYKRLEPIMTRILNATGNMNLHELYEQASYLDPEVREQVLSDRAKAAEAKALEAANAKREEAEEAMKASRNVNGTTRVPNTAKKRSTMEIIRANNKRLTA